MGPRFIGQIFVANAKGLSGDVQDKTSRQYDSDLSAKSGAYFNFFAVSVIIKKKKNVGSSLLAGSIEKALNLNLKMMM